jgi:hypothetical protein
MSGPWLSTLGTSFPTGIQSSIQSVNGPVANLPNWSKGDLNGKKIVWLGDSTTNNAFANFMGTGGVDGSATTGTFCKFHQAPGMRLYGVIHYNFGWSGERLLGAGGWNSDTWGALSANLSGRTNGNLSAIVALNPDLIILCLGINDVRLQAQGIGQTEMTAGLTAACDRIRAALPNCDIVLRMPNVLMADTSSISFIVMADGVTAGTLAFAQSASDALRLSYRAMVGKYPNVAVWDCQGGTGDPIFPEQVPSAQATNGYLTNHVLMTDQLHPTTTASGGLAIQLDHLAKFIGKDRQLDVGSCINAWNRNSTNPHIIYPRCIEASLTQFGASKQFRIPQMNSDLLAQASYTPVYYDLICWGENNTNVTTAAPGYIDTSPTNGGFVAAQGVITKNSDIVVQYGVTGTAGTTNDYLNTTAKENVVNGVVAWTIPAGASIGASNARISGLGSGYPGTTPIANGGINLIVRKRPTTQKTAWTEAPNFAIGGAAMTASTTNFAGPVAMAGLYTSATIKAVTAPTTGGTVTLAQNGTTFATIVWANGSAIATITWAAGASSGQAGGVVFNEGDFITAAFDANFVGGANWSCILEKPQFPSFNL